VTVNDDHRTSSRRSPLRPTGWAAALLVLVALAFSAVTALGQGVPGGPDLPPPDAAPAPAPTPAPTPAPAPPSDPAPAAPSNPAQTQTGPSPEEQAAQQAQDEAARQAQLERQRELARLRREAIARQRAREKRAKEFRDVSGFAAAQSSIVEDVDSATQTLDGLAVTAAVEVPAAAASPQAESSNRGKVLLVILLGASVLSALLVLMPLGLSRGDAIDRPANGPVHSVARVQSYVVTRMPFVEAHRVELAGVSVGCLLVALLILVGAF
jgi:hypothetical protein